MKGKNKETARFREVYDRQFSRVYKLALFLLSNRDDAEDTVQTVFARYWEKQPRFSDEGHENAWFLTVTRNLCRDLQKEYYRKHKADMDEAEQAPQDFALRRMETAAIP